MSASNFQKVILLLLVFLCSGCIPFSYLPEEETHTTCLKMSSLSIGENQEQVKQKLGNRGKPGFIYKEGSDEYESRTFYCKDTGFHHYLLFKNGEFNNACSCRGCPGIEQSPNLKVQNQELPSYSILINEFKTAFLETNQNLYSGNFNFLYREADSYEPTCGSRLKWACVFGTGNVIAFPCIVATTPFLLPFDIYEKHSYSKYFKVSLGMNPDSIRRTLGDSYEVLKTMDGNDIWVYRYNRRDLTVYLGLSEKEVVWIRYYYGDKHEVERYRADIE